MANSNNIAITQLVEDVVANSIEMLLDEKPTQMVVHNYLKSDFKTHFKLVHIDAILESIKAQLEGADFDIKITGVMLDDNGNINDVNFRIDNLTIDY